jgi:hypothetical protein
VVPHLFSYFFAEAETNTETPKTNMKTDIIGSRYGPNTVRRRNMIRMVAETRNSLNHAEKFKQLKQTNKLVL